MRILSGLLAIFALFACAFPAVAQVGTATLDGRVTDPSGLPVVGVKVQATNAATGNVSIAETNSIGLYSIPALAPGMYQINVNKEGFQQIERQGVTLHVADIVAVNFILSIGQVEQTVAVTAEAPLVNTTSGSLGGLVNEDKVADLP